jgi:hypothetical protein
MLSTINCNLTQWPACGIFVQIQKAPQKCHKYMRKGFTGVGLDWGQDGFGGFLGLIQWICVHFLQ